MASVYPRLAALARDRRRARAALAPASIAVSASPVFIHAARKPPTKVSPAPVESSVVDRVGGNDAGRAILHVGHAFSTARLNAQRITIRRVRSSEGFRGELGLAAAEYDDVGARGERRSEIRRDGARIRLHRPDQRGAGTRQTERLPGRLALAPP